MAAAALFLAFNPWPEALSRFFPVGPKQQAQDGKPKPDAEQNNDAGDNPRASEITESASIDVGDRVLAMALAPDDRHAIFVMANTMQLWDLQEKKEIRKLSGQDLVMGVVFTPDGSRAVSAGLDRTIRTWDWQAGREVGQIKVGGIPLLSADGSHFVTYNGAEGGYEIVNPERPNVAFRTQDYLLMLERKGFADVVWSTPVSGNMEWGAVANGSSKSIFAKEFTCVDKTIISADGKRCAAMTWEGSLMVWEGESGKLLRGWHELARSPERLAMSPNGQLIAATNVGGVLLGGRKAIFGEPFPKEKRDFAILLRNVETGETRRLEGHKTEPLILRFFPDNRRLLSFDFEKSLRVWDVQTGKELTRFEGLTGNVINLTISSEGQRLLVSGEDKKVRLLHVAGSKK